jgi:hypothetical protein
LPRIPAVIHIEVFSQKYQTKHWLCAYLIIYLLSSMM